MSYERSRSNVSCHSLRELLEARATRLPSAHGAVVARSGDSGRQRGARAQSCTLPARAICGDLWRSAGKRHVSLAEICGERWRFLAFREISPWGLCKGVWWILGVDSAMKFAVKAAVKIMMNFWIKFGCFFGEHFVWEYTAPKRPRNSSQIHPEIHREIRPKL